MAANENLILVIIGAIGALIGAIFLMKPKSANAQQANPVDIAKAAAITEAVKDGFFNDKDIVRVTDLYVEWLPKTGDRTTTSIVAFSQLTENDKRVVANWWIAKNAAEATNNTAKPPTAIAPMVQVSIPTPVPTPAASYKPVANLAGLNWSSYNGMKIAIIDLLKFNGNWMPNTYIASKDKTDVFDIRFSYYGELSEVKSGSATYDVGLTGIRTNGAAAGGYIAEMKTQLFNTNKAKYDAINDYNSLNPTASAADRQRIIDNYCKYVSGGISLIVNGQIGILNTVPTPAPPAAAPPAMKETVAASIPAYSAAPEINMDGKQGFCEPGMVWSNKRGYCVMKDFYDKYG